LSYLSLMLGICLGASCSRLPDAQPMKLSMVLGKEGPVVVDGMH
jgi:hypothetical protein